MATLKCTITRIIFQDGDNPFAILETSGGKVSGEIAEDLVVGSVLTLTGEYITTATGKEFRVLRLVSIDEAPEDTGALWLAWRLPHIGPIRSVQLSQRLGERLWEFMDGPQDEVARVLESMRGLTAKNVKELQAAYLQFPNELRLAMFLGHPDPERPMLGMKFRVFKLAIKEYHDARGLNAQIEEDLFELFAISGVAYPALNRLAQGLDWNERDPRWLRGISWSLLEYRASKGDTAMPWDDLMRALKHDEFTQDIEEVREVLGASAHLVVETHGVQLLRFAQAEATIANRVGHLLEDEREQLELDLSRLPDWLDASQRKAVAQLAKEPFAVLTGGPGTGKTTVLKQLLALLKQTPHAVVRLASPTGKAAKRMSEVTGQEATTVHRLLEWRPTGFARNARSPIDASVIIVDEASMLDTIVGAALFAAVARGARLILVGDVDQLPPVSAGQVLQDLIESKSVPVVKLTETHRQGKDSWVIDAAPVVLKGGMPSLETQSDFSFISKDNPKDIAEAVVGVYRTARMNGTEGSLQVLTPEWKNGAGVNMLNNTLQRTLNPNWSKDDTANSVTASKVKIFAGDKVLYTKNKVELGLVNGSIGVVMEASTDRFTVAATVRFAGESNPRAEETGEDPEVFHLEGEDVQPLILAYAMTVHKAQGSEWSQIAVICEKSHSSMRRRLLYTAITRTSKNLLIIGDAASVRRAAQRNEDENRKTLLVQRLKAQGQ